MAPVLAAVPSEARQRPEVRGWEWSADGLQEKAQPPEPERPFQSWVQEREWAPTWA